MDGCAIWITLVIQSVLLIASALYGGALLVTQWSSAHYQATANAEGRLYALFALSGILVLEFMSGKAVRKGGPDVPGSAASSG